MDRAQSSQSSPVASSTSPSSPSSSSTASLVSPSSFSSSPSSHETKDDDDLKQRQFAAWMKAEDTYNGTNSTLVDKTVAASLYEEAANLGYVPAMHECGLIYR